MGPARQQFEVPYVVVGDVPVQMVDVMLARYPATLSNPRPSVRQNLQAAGEFDKGVSASAIVIPCIAPRATHRCLSRRPTGHTPALIGSSCLPVQDALWSAKQPNNLRATFRHVQRTVRTLAYALPGFNRIQEL